MPDDPSAETVLERLDPTDDWMLTAPGDYTTAAAEAWQADGSGYQRVVLLEWPARRNHTDEYVQVRLMIAPEDAAGLAEVLAHTAMWLKADAERDRT